MAALDRRTHDVDVIERVLGGVRDRRSEDARPTHVVDLHNAGDGERHSTVELTVRLSEDERTSDHIRRYGRP